MPRPATTLDLRRATAALHDAAGRPRSMARIAATLGMAKPTLFKLAGSRAALETACVEAAAERLVGHLPQLADGSLAAAVDAVGALAAEAPGAPRLLFGPSGESALRRVEDRLGDLLRRADAVPEGLTPPEAGAALLAAGAAVARRRAAVA